MENTIKGWQYISAIFQRMLDSFERDCLIEPLFIFIWITRRYFSSSKSINEYLQLHPNLDIANKNMPNPQEFLYKKFYNEFIREYKELKNVSPLDTLEHLMKCDNYKYTVPEYIKSGAAIRMQNLKNRSHIDYINYIKNLIDDAKYRFSEYAAENYSDIEILADIQHKGGASCLVDFSNNFLISLWFATQTNKDDKDFGYLFCYDINVEMIEKDNLSMLSHSKSKDTIENLLYATTKSTKYTEDKSYKFWLWKPSYLNERIARQDSIFIFGLEPFANKDHGVLVIPIPPDWKKNIQLVLKSYFGITEESIYCDSNGFATSHDKTKPYERVTTSFFNEYFSPITKNKKMIFCNIQNGMACLFQGEYELALQYFMNFESCTRDKIKLYINNKLRSTSIEEYIQDINMFMIDIELHFSKALCLRNLGHKYRAIEEYIIAEQRCISLISKIGASIKMMEIERNKKDKSFERIKRLQKYANTKYQKIAKDLMDLFYDTKQYERALELVSSIQKNTPCPSEPLMETIKNEIKTLNELTKNIMFDSRIDSSIITRETVGSVQPFFYILNCYFLFVLESVHNKKIKQKSFDELKKKIENYSCSDFSKSCHFTKWDFSDITSLIDNYKQSNFDLYNGLMVMTAHLEDFMAYINSKLKIQPY